ncbi:MAG: ABC transporter ATP-binding protein [Pseudomonadota bacterium]
MACDRDTDAAIALDAVGFGWPGGRFGLTVADFRVAQGETVLLLGQSGSGKSTLLSLICGIVAPRTGSVRVAGQDLGALSGAARDRFRADKIGVIFQMFNLLPYATAIDNILIPMRFSADRRARCPVPRDEALRLTAGLGLTDAQVTGGPASALSVGQQQRVAVARAMIGAPPIVIADEPTSALDATTQGEFLDLVFGQVRAAGTTLLMVSHDPRLAEQFDRVVQLSEIATQEGPA